MSETQQIILAVGSISGALWTLLSVINGLVQDPEAKSFIGKLIDFFAFLSRAQAPGTVKAPFMLSKTLKARSKLSVPNDTPPPPAAAFLPMLFLSILTLYACATVKATLIDFGKCELGQVPSALSGVLTDVDKTLGGESPNWQSDMETIGKKAGIDAVNCAVAAVLHNLAAKKSALDEVGRRKNERGQIWLAAHKVAK
jgi:hypothetical protein